MPTPSPTLRERWDELVVQVYARTPERLRRAVLRLFTPGWRVGVLVVLRRPDGRVLLVDQPYNEGWSLPGGDLKRGEDLATGGAREVREELGLDVIVPTPELAAARHADRWVTFVVAVDITDEIADRAGAVSAELTAIGWFAPDQLPLLHRDTVMPLRLVGVPASA
jgi:8-oxo-dGTP pyrophosphatase MutT (NUDIX family)